MLRRAFSFLWYAYARALCRAFCALVFRYRFYGRKHEPRQGGYILLANHQSFLDPVFCGVGVRRHLTYMARDTLFRSWAFGWLIRSLHAIPLERNKADVAAMREILSRLKAGGAVCLFPEATRTHDGRIQPFKRGFGLLCRRARVPIVLALIDGAYECWPRHKTLFRSGTVTVWLGEPIEPDEVRGMKDDELAEFVGGRLRRMQAACRNRLGKRPYEYPASDSSADARGAESG